jgi:hypothetical protein
MKLTQRRWWVWAILAVVTVLAVRWVDGGEAPPARDVAVSEAVSPAERQGQAGAAGALAPVTAEVTLDRLRRAPYPALTSDPFRSDIEPDTMSPEGGFGGGVAGQRSTGSSEPPPLPFTYMGKMLEDGETVVFLTRGDRNYLARKGATLDGQYRVDAIGPRTMVLTYLPAKAKQSLAIGSAP